ncbi:MAG TPA: hypothetical protein VFW87_27170 [Pirellulales bacterium]|nr:hypothetical protein [Pirellulales bacterium]
MTPILSDEQRVALERLSGGPLFVDDPVKHVQYVLIPAEAYQKARGILEADTLDLRETYAAQERALGAAGWDDPALDAYNDYDVGNLMSRGIAKALSPPPATNH